MINKVIFIKLTPLEPYFLGGERVFEIGEQNTHYYIRSLDVPTQTTLFGVLRFMMMSDTRKKSSNEKYADKPRLNNAGSTSFNLLDNSKSFGCIEKISPLYIVDNDNKLYIPTPSDHNSNSNVGDDGKIIYTPFKTDSDYYKEVETTDGLKKFPEDYNAKRGNIGGWMRVDNGEICMDLLKSVPRVGIYKKGDIEAFFKREYKMLKKGFSFGFFAYFDENKRGAQTGEYIKQKIVYLGQGKSPFSVDTYGDVDENIFSEPTDKTKELLQPHILYAQSDLYLNEIYENVRDFYKNFCFVNAETKDFRGFVTDFTKTDIKNRFKRYSMTIKLIKAGSIFYAKKNTDLIKKFDTSHAKIAGFNNIIFKGENL
ncbi:MULTISPECIES: type III-B CRISPR module-associated Cmr3 family protein [Caproicibacterium]|uniref:Type III-B CRISPR module-associated Cmr3 family protein n=1 Tax=Caproicibacterium argilliputei TaxID=3030016 RepID=A0AA97D8U8_9FIRM|nr:type III-B CRISPR module-associated Cmr3 family protein [Caproicibacterium argilliputei]WOC31812.1 type III-B CRISPR module-associated Cmr3 family protein [Caproicibacterium argilliputei]